MNQYPELPELFCELDIGWSSCHHLGPCFPIVLFLFFKVPGLKLKSRQKGTHIVKGLMGNLVAIKAINKPRGFTLESVALQTLCRGVLRSFGGHSFFKPGSCIGTRRECITRSRTRRIHPNLARAHPHDLLCTVVPFFGDMQLGHGTLIVWFRV